MVAKKAKQKTLVYPLISACWVLLLYWPVWTAPFLYDDITTVQSNPVIAHLHSTLAYFCTTVAFSSDFTASPQSHYRPLFWLSLAIDRGIWGLNPLGFHLTNLFLHWVNGLLGFWLLRRLRVAVSIAAAACLIWLGLPINTEVVAWISARPYCLTVFFILLTLLSATWYTRRRGWPPLLCVFLASSGAVLSHEMGVLALPLTLLVLFASHDFIASDWIALCAIELAADASYLAARHIAGATAPAGTSALGAIGSYFFKYLSWIVLPIRMSIERSTDTPSVGLSFANAICLAGLLCFLALIVIARKKYPQISAGLLWLCITLLPFCGLVFIYQGMAERYAYLASAGLAFAIAAAFIYLPLPSRRIASILVLCWIAWGAWRANARAADWADEASLYKNSLEATRRSWILWLNLGNTYLRHGMAKQAATAYQDALSIRPDAVKAVVNLGAALQTLGDTKAAEQQYERAITLAPTETDVYCNLGALVFEEGNIEYARQLFNKAIQLDPNNATAYFDLGVLTMKSGDLQQAEALFKKALQLNPNYPDAQHALAVLTRRSNQTSSGNASPNNR